MTLEALNPFLVVKRFCPFQVRNTLAEGIFNSAMIYCLPLFGGMGKTLCNRLQSLQNRAARFVYNAPQHVHRSKLFRKLEWLSVNQLTLYHTLVTVYKMLEANDLNMQLEL